MLNIFVPGKRSNFNVESFSLLKSQANYSCFVCEVKQKLDTNTNNISHNSEEESESCTAGPAIDRLCPSRRVVSNYHVMYTFYVRQKSLLSILLMCNSPHFRGVVVVNIPLRTQNEYQGFYIHYIHN